MEVEEEVYLNSGGVYALVVEELLDPLGHAHVLRQVEAAHLGVEVEEDVEEEIEVEKEV